VAFENVGVWKVNRKKRVDRNNACSACGSPTTNPKYCTNQCQRDHVWQLTLAKIDQSGQIPANKSGHSRVARRYLLLKQGRCCAICDLTEWRGQPIPLVLDHINGNSVDWHVTNLRLVCGNCDMQLPTFKSKNRGRGRAWRRDRYAKGQSY
jgi:hypothetical protein